MKNNLHPSPLHTFLPRSQRRVLALLVILVVFLLNAAWNTTNSSPPSRPHRAEATRTLVATPTHSNLVNTPSQEEILANHSQTNGIAILGGILVLVIVAGTFFVLRRKA